MNDQLKDEDYRKSILLTSFKRKKKQVDVSSLEDIEIKWPLTGTFVLYR